ncbi:MAG TPA: 50S ribosomal protein L7 [Candidatus Faecousia intestinigallinarum]|nr:50S ribosomal protein L7 [Candidatus Faecousia intestinigallinarum]
MGNPLQYLSLGRKGNLVELGEDPVNAVTRAGKAALVAVASDASEHTWRRAKSFVAGTSQSCLRLPFTKDEMGQAVGRASLAIAAITDASLALAIVKALPAGEAQDAVLAVLEEKARRQQQRRKEAKAHEHNRQAGKTRRSDAKKEH